MQRISVSSAGELAVAHRTAEGIALTRKRDDAWATQVLSSDRGRPEIIHGAAGDVQIYYSVDTDWDGLEDELRRVREGTCAPASK